MTGSLNYISVRLKAGALFFALAISLVIGLIIGSVLLLEYCNRALLLRDKIREEVIRNSHSGIQLLCASDAETYREGKMVDLFGRGKDSVFVKSVPWGAYDVLVSNAVTGTQSHEEIVMVGAVTDSASAFALWLADLDRPLSITGSTRITGACYLPQSGVERAYIEGKSYSGNQLIYGVTKNSGRFVPVCNAERIDLLEKLPRGDPGTEDSLFSWDELMLNDSLSNSFHSRTILISEEKPLLLNNIFLSGNISIRSKSVIRISESAILKNVVVAAPKVIIDKNVSGQFQVVASDSIIVQDDVQLHYPSALIICTKESAATNSAIVTGENFRCEGSVFCNRSNNDLRVHSLVSLGKNCTVTGEVYCSDQLELKGSVFGSVTCSILYLQTNSAVYENHLVDAVIDRSKFPAAFCFGLLTRNASGIRKPIQWL